MKRRLTILILAISSILMLCSNYTRVDWQIHWELRNATDSSIVSDTVRYLFALEYADRVSHGKTDSGFINVSFYFEHKTSNDFFSSNPILKVSLFIHDSLFLDTVIAWNNMVFIEKHNDFFISEKTIYVDNK